MTFFLVFVVFATAVDSKGAFNKIGGFAIGLTITMDILFGGPFTGAAMNPSRAFGPALATTTGRITASTGLARFSVAWSPPSCTTASSCATSRLRRNHGSKLHGIPKDDAVQSARRSPIVCRARRVLGMERCKV